MTGRDLIDLSVANLWRMKLRAVLTTAGVMIAIGAFVALLSFGAGNQAYVSEQFNELGLLHTMQVFPEDKEELPDTVEPGVLNDASLAKLNQIPGVRLVYPLDAFSIEIASGDSVAQVDAQALPVSVLSTRMFEHMAAGERYQSDTARQIIISERMAEQLGFAEPDSAVGQAVAVAVELASLDSGLVNVFRDPTGERQERLRQVEVDSLRYRAYIERLVRSELSDAARLFFSGYMDHKMTVVDTPTIVGVVENRVSRQGWVRSVIMPTPLALRLNSGGMNTDPTNLVTALNSGALFAKIEDSSVQSYPRVTLDFDPSFEYQPIKDSVKALGFRCFSYAEEFEEILRFFVYFDLFLGIVGLIALTTASLGIINTMVMSIMERRREIGVLMSLGADPSRIRLLFLVESGVIGLFGSIAGIVLGWGVSRIISAVAKAIMEGEGLQPVEFFALPLWLIGAALALGTGVAVLAGLFPAAKAARIDPVEALRQE